jgi:D-alanyl-D-alanine carboxypeptidase/D-alanyl-D-alanine-endopeptidase (penicillin-binding protein 4)
MTSVETSQRGSLRKRAKPATADRAEIRAIADSVADRIDRVDGDLVLDVSRFEGPHLGPGRVWTDASHAYGAPASALALAGNVVAVTVQTGGGISTSVEPSTDAVAVEVDAGVDPEAAAHDGSDLDVYTDPHGGGVRVEGRLPPGAEATVEVPVSDPVRHCGLATRGALSATGVDVGGAVRIADGAPECGQQLAAVESAPVADLVRSMNVDSDNVIADSLARAVAAVAVGEGSWDAWASMVDDRVTSLGVEPARVRDGSGLSRYNLVSARGVVALLEWATDRPWSDAFFGSLPEAGEGTLADRLAGVPVAAKTGTLTGVRALSGQVGAGDDAVLFAVLVGGVTVDEESVRGRQDDFVRALAAASGSRE